MSFVREGRRVIKQTFAILPPLVYLLTPNFNLKSLLFTYSYTPYSSTKTLMTVVAGDSYCKWEGRNDFVKMYEELGAGTVERVLGTCDKEVVMVMVMVRRKLVATIGATITKCVVPSMCVPPWPTL